MRFNISFDVRHRNLQGYAVLLQKSTAASSPFGRSRRARSGWLHIWSSCRTGSRSWRGWWGKD